MTDLDTRQFNRGCRIRIVPESGPEITINPRPHIGPGQPKEHPLRVRFSVHKSVTSESQRATIVVHNLSERVRNALVGEAVDPFPGPGRVLGSSLSVKLEAGYNGVLGSIFEGQLPRVRNRKANRVTWATAINSDDSSLIMGETVPEPHTFGPGVTARQLLAAAVRNSGGLRIGPSPLLAELDAYVSTQGFVVMPGATRRALIEELMGPLRAELCPGEQVCDEAPTWWVDDEVLWMSRPRVLLPGPPIVVSSDGTSGVQLVASPEPMDRDHLQIHTLLCPQMRVGFGVTLVSGKRSGTFRCKELVHSGDNYAGRYVTSAILESLEPVGGLF